MRELNPIYGTIFKTLESATVPNRIELKSSTSIQSDKPNDTNVKEDIKPGTAVGAILSICFSGTAVVVPIVAYLIFKGDKRGYDAIGIVLTITAAFSIIGLVLGFRALKKIKNKSKRYKVLALVGVSLAGLVGLGFFVLLVALVQGF